MNWLLGTPQRVYAHEPTPGHVHAVVDYGGASGVVEGSMAMPRSYPFASSIRVLGEAGVAEYGFLLSVPAALLQVHGSAVQQASDAGLAFNNLLQLES